MHCVGLSIYLSIHLSSYISYLDMYASISLSFYLSLPIYDHKTVVLRLNSSSFGKNKIYSVLKMMSFYGEFIF